MQDDDRTMLVGYPCPRLMSRQGRIYDEGRRELACSLVVSQQTEEDIGKLYSRPFLLYGNQQ